MNRNIPPPRPDGTVSKAKGTHEPKTADEVLALASFFTSLKDAEQVHGCPFGRLSLEKQDAIILERLRQLVGICRVNPLWRQRIVSAIGSDPLENFEAYQALPLLDKDAFREMFTGSRPGMVVPVDRCGFQVVASGGTSSGMPSETVYPLDELRETYAWAGEFIGRHLMSRYLPGNGAKWVVTTLADYQMWSSGSMVGGVLQKIPGFNYIGAGPMSREVYQLMMSYDGPKAIMGITQSIALLPCFAEGLTMQARDSLRVALYGSGVLTPKVRADLKAAYPNVAILSYFAATQAETIGLQLEEETPTLTAVPGLHLIEVVDSQGRWVSPGEEGELVVTRLFGNAAPVLRYKVGDRVVRRADRIDANLNAMQFEYVGRSGDFMHIGDTQYSASRALDAIAEEFLTRDIFDINAVACEAQFQIHRASGQFHLVISARNAEALMMQVVTRLGSAGSAPVIIAGLSRSLSVFNALEANEDSIARTGYRFGLKIVEPGSPEIVRTELGKTPLVIDAPYVFSGQKQGGMQ